LIFSENFEKHGSNNHPTLVWTSDFPRISAGRPLRVERLGTIQRYQGQPQGKKQLKVETGNNRGIPKFTLSSPYLWASFHFLSPLSMVSTQYLMKFY
jgi:hypothetical protein